MPFKKGHKGHPRKSRSSVGRTASPAIKDDVSDEEMIDQGDDADAEVTRDATPQEGAGDEDDDAHTSAPEDDDDDDDADSPPQITTIPRRRGRGRGPGRPPTRHIGTPEVGDDGSESGTPFKRKRGRPVGSGRGGFRGRRKGAPPEAPHVMFEGQKIDVVNDEAQIDQDDEGDEKVDENGFLKGGREYRVRTFTISGRGEKLYMLSTEPARCCGFRDSYLFFTKHPKLYKVLVNDAEKKDLIDRDILPSSYKGRNIGVVIARSVFREFGARIIVGGRRIIDDYKVSQARANGEIEGELADPDDLLPAAGEPYNRNRYVAWFGASEVYRNTGGAGATGAGKPAPLGSKRRNNITIGNWQFMHAKEASRFNAIMTATRHNTHNGVYDPHTNLMFYPTAMQPTHAKWEQLPVPTHGASPQKLTNGLANLDGENGTDPMSIDSKQTTEQQTPTIFSDVPPVVSRNYAVVDTTYSAPPISNAGFPGPDGIITDPTSGTQGLSNVPADVLDELPDDCRKAFEEAKAAEVGWKKQWGTEADSGMRGGLKIGFSGYPV